MGRAYRGQGLALSSNSGGGLASENDKGDSRAGDQRQDDYGGWKIVADVELRAFRASAEKA